MAAAATGPLEFISQWPTFEIGETRVRIDAQAILDAARRAVRLWPGQHLRAAPSTWLPCASDPVRGGDLRTLTDAPAARSAVTWPVQRANCNQALGPVGRSSVTSPVAELLMVIRNLCQPVTMWSWTGHPPCI